MALPSGQSQWAGWSSTAKPPVSTLSGASPVRMPSRNTKELTRETLINALNYMGSLVPSQFAGRPLRLVIHGGAWMLLHPEMHRQAKESQLSVTSLGGTDIPCRKCTRDVDFIRRGFIKEYSNMGFLNADERLQHCIESTANQFRLGLDWMNSDADVSLPPGIDPATGRTIDDVDPIYDAAIDPHNITHNTIFTSENRMLTLIGVPPPWAIALKLVRYNTLDEGDICNILRCVSTTSGHRWTVGIVEEWLRRNCDAMQYRNYSPQKRTDVLKKIENTVKTLAHVSSGQAAALDPVPVPSNPWHDASGPPQYPQQAPSAPTAGPSLSRMTSPMGWGGPGVQPAPVVPHAAPHQPPMSRSTGWAGPGPDATVHNTSWPTNSGGWAGPGPDARAARLSTSSIDFSGSSTIPDSRTMTPASIHSWGSDSSDPHRNMTASWSSPPPPPPPPPQSVHPMFSNPLNNPPPMHPNLWAQMSQSPFSTPSSNKEPPFIPPTRFLTDPSLMVDKRQLASRRPRTEPIIGSSLLEQRKAEKKSKDRNYVRRMKYMVGWREPDDSDPETESDYSSDSEDEREPRWSRAVSVAPGARSKSQHKSSSALAQSPPPPLNLRTASPWFKSPPPNFDPDAPVIPPFAPHNNNDGFHNVHQFHQRHNALPNFYDHGNHHTSKRRGKSVGPSHSGHAHY